MESFNNAVLMYIDKRIHFRTQMYALRMGLAILDWNENVDRQATSVRHYMHAGNMNERNGTRVLGKKSRQYVYNLWQEFVQLLLQADIVHGEADMDFAEVSDIDEEDIDNSMFDDN